MPLISLTILILLAGALLSALLPQAKLARLVALLATSAAFLVSIAFYVGFDPNTSVFEPQFLERVALLAGADVSYTLGIDGINLLLVMLTTLLGPIVVLASWTYITKHFRAYYALIQLLMAGVVGVFTSFDLLVFYVFFELTLIPMYFIIGVWGSENRVYAALKFVIYTLVGSLLMLVGIIYLGIEAGNAINGGVFTTDYFKLLSYQIPAETQGWLFLLFALSFAIKVPLFPLHTWLPDAHTEAPTGGSVVLAGVLLKMGTYGLLRFTLPFFPEATMAYAMPIAILAVIGIVYGALVSRVQTDAKKLVAYSSVSHLGFVVLGLMAFNEIAVQGALIQMINHGISTGALFLIVGMLYERRHTRLMADYGGIAKRVPVLTTFMIISVLASAGLPGLNGFIGEFMILIGSFSSDVVGSPWLIAVATTGVILAAVYLLHMVYKVFFGPITHQENDELADLNVRETIVLIPLIVLMVIMGFAPRTFLEKSENHNAQLLEIVHSKVDAAVADTAVER